MRALPRSVNQMLPAGSSAIPHGSAPGEETENAVSSPPGVRRPMALFLIDVNQTLPSLPAAIPRSAARSKISIEPAGVIRPI